MNRQLRRAQAKQDAADQKSGGGQPRQRSTQRAADERKRVGARQFTREVIAEMRKVLWPTRTQVRNSTMIVLVTIVVLTSYIWLVDTVFNRLIFEVILK